MICKVHVGISCSLDKLHNVTEFLSERDMIYNSSRFITNSLKKLKLRTSKLCVFLMKS